MNPFRFDDFLTPPEVPADVSEKWKEAPLYAPSPSLKETMELAVMLRIPLLLTGQPGSGKTSAAYWAAWRMGLTHEDLFHAQIRSDSTASSLKYDFDAVRYFRESQLNREKAPKREDFLRKFPLYEAFERSHERTVVLLLDEIDKAPRDLPNDLLHEFDLMEFTVPDLAESVHSAPTVKAYRAKDWSESRGLRLVVFTSNAERSLPDAFLRRCVHHHIRIDEAEIRRVVEHREDLHLGAEFLELAVHRFVQLADMGLLHKPGISELLVWLRALELRGVDADKLRGEDLARLPYLGLLLKTHKDHELVAPQR